MARQDELRLERDRDWQEFLRAAEKTLDRPWDLAKDEEQADEHFSHVLHTMMPDRFREPTSWLEARAGSRTGIGTSAREAVQAVPLLGVVCCVGVEVHLLES